MATSKDDIALVTACRDALWKPRPGILTVRSVGEPALSLIEDTLNRHAPAPGFVKVSNSTAPEPPDPICAVCRRLYPCATTTDALAALHTIATALGVDPE